MPENRCLLVKKRELVAIAEYTKIDESIHEHTVADMHVAQTTPQGTQFDGLVKGHEHRDVSVRAIMTWFTGLFLFIIVLAGGLIALFFGILHQQSKGDTVPSATFKSSIVNAPLSQEGRLLENEKVDSYVPTTTETPPLMPDPHTPMVVLRQQEDSEVNNYGYVVDAQGKRVGVHIPVQEAMKQVLDKGFAVVASPTSIRPPAPVSPALEPAQDKGY